jgi:hypothetical protein
VAVRGSDGDDPVGVWHLELEVRVVGDGHELGIARPSQHRVVGPSEPDHLEREGFFSEVGGSPEVSHPALRNKARCISYMRQEDSIYNNRVYRDKCHKTSEYLLHSGRLITK